MRKVLIVMFLFVFSFAAKSITFNEAAQKNPQRVNPAFKNGQILSFYDSIKEAKKSVVNIATSKFQKNNYNELLDELMNNPYFRQFFGGGYNYHKRSQKKIRSLGSGVIISKDGYIVTNNHVVEDSDEIIVSIYDSDKEYAAKIVGTDPKSDLAVIKIDTNEELIPITFGDSSYLKEGDIVFAIGNPFGVGESITQGIVSALNKNRVGINQYENFIQTDASINPGNSGGALVDSRGMLVGINSAILTRSGGNNGIGFAIPSNMVKRVAKSLIEKGRTVRGYLGVTIGDLTKELKKVYVSNKGAIILKVEPNSPADKAGLEMGDLITEVGGIEVKNSTDLKNAIASFEPDSKIEVKYERDGKIKTAQVTLGILPSSFGINGELNIYGMTLKNLTPQIIKNYRLPNDTKGILVKDIKPNSRAFENGFKRGDIIFRVERNKIDNILDFEKIMKKDDKIKRIYLLRGGFVFILTLP